jgi:small subunit ribosomal protein S17
MARVLSGEIISEVKDKTITVKVTRVKTHPIYKKRYKVSKKYLVDTNNFSDLRQGQFVEITESRPLSKRKYFILSAIKEVK